MASSASYDEDEALPWPPPPPLAPRPSTHATHHRRPARRVARPAPSPPPSPPAPRPAGSVIDLDVLMGRLGLGEAATTPPTTAKRVLRPVSQALPQASPPPRVCSCCGRPKRPRPDADGAAAADAPSPPSVPPTAVHPAVARILHQDERDIGAVAVAPRAVTRPGGAVGAGPAAASASPPPPPTSPRRLHRRRRVDRLDRYNEFQEAWAADPFLAVGGDARHPHRPRGALAAAFAAEHAALARSGWGA